MRSKTELDSQPVHPILAAIPVGLWGASLISDLIYAVGGNQFFYDMAQWTMGLGVLAGIVAVMPGLIDYFTLASRKERTAQNAYRREAIGLAVLTAYAVDWVLHLAGAEDGPMLAIAVLLNIVAFTGLIAGARLGRGMVQKHAGASDPIVRVTMMDEERIKSDRF